MEWKFLAFSFKRSAVFFCRRSTAEIVFSLFPAFGKVSHWLKINPSPESSVNSELCNFAVKVEMYFRQLLLPFMHFSSVIVLT